MAMTLQKFVQHEHFPRPLHHLVRWADHLVHKEEFFATIPMRRYVELQARFYGKAKREPQAAGRNTCVPKQSRRRHGIVAPSWLRV